MMNCDKDKNQKRLTQKHKEPDIEEARGVGSFIPVVCSWGGWGLFGVALYFACVGAS